MVRRFITILGCIMMVLAVAGCTGQVGPIVIGTASLPPDALQHGTLYQVDRGGIIWIGDVNIPFSGVDTSGGEPVACMGFGTAKHPSLGSSDVRLHLGETATYPGLGTITLVSFDKGWSIQRVTLLVDLEEQPDAIPTPTPTGKPS